MAALKFRFKSGESGLGQVLGKLEKAVMEILWQKGEISGRDIFEKLKKQRGLAYTTILTVLDRLAKKGFVKKIKENDIYMFRPALDKEEFTDRLSKEIIRGVIEISGSSATSLLVDVLTEADPESIEELSSLIEKKKTEVKKRTS